MSDNDTPQREPIRGVFSTEEVKKIGTGMTLKKTRVKQYWLVQEASDGIAEVQPINENLIPIGKKRTVSVGTLLERFAPEPDFFVSSDMFDQPEAEEEEATPASAEPGPEVAGFDISGSPEEVEKNARASFGLGIMYLKRGNNAKAQEIFAKLAEIDAAFAPEHKHMFNDFGISLRKEKLYETALKHYLRARELDNSDENLIHNIARAYFEIGDLDNTHKFLEESLQINPSLKASQLFLNFLNKKKTPKKNSKPIRMDF